MVNSDMNEISQTLQSSVLLDPPEERFDAIMDDLAHERRKHNLWLPMAAMMILMVGAWLLFPQIQPSSDGQMDLLIKKVNTIEMAVLSQSVKHSGPGSELLEKMISMENWLVQLNTNIAQSTDEQQTLALLNAKLDVLDDLVALQNKMKPQAESEQPLI